VEYLDSLHLGHPDSVRSGQQGASAVRAAGGQQLLEVACFST